MSTEYRDTITGDPYAPEDLPIVVCMSAAGYYVGQLEPCGAPFSRLSGYFKTREDAEKHLSEGWVSRECEENKSIEDRLKKAGKLTMEAIH